MEHFPELHTLFNKLQLELYGDRTLTENMAGAFTTTGDKCLDFFATVVRDTSVEGVLCSFVEAWNEDPDKALKLLLNLRDIRKGKGEKKLPTVLMYALSCWKPLTYLANIQRFLQVGCYKDLLLVAELAVRCAEINQLTRIPQLNNDPIELKLFACQLLNDEKDLDANDKAGISLCAKWAPTEMCHFDHKPLRFSRKITNALGIKKSEYRKKLSKLRGHLNVLEMLMATGKWDQIIFKSLPAKGHRLYRKAFKRELNRKLVKSEDRVKTAKRYAEYLKQLNSGKTTIKSTGTQPHELIQLVMNDRGEKKLDLTIKGQWKDMIAKLAKTGKFKHVQAVCDVSASMEGIPMQVSIALGLVVAELTEAPFKNKLITFSQQPALHKITGNNLRDRVACLQNMPWGNNTDLLKVFELLIREAEANPGAKMVEKLFIFTDMQFDEANANEPANNYSVQFSHESTIFDDAKTMLFEEANPEQLNGINTGQLDEANSMPLDEANPEQLDGINTGQLNEPNSMQVEEANPENPWTTTYETICKMYTDKGFVVPKIIFWNLRATHSSFPVQKDEVGTALISGFSAQMMKAFLANDSMDEFTPLSIMNETLDKYEITKVPQERNPIDLEAVQPGFEAMEQIVHEFLVPKKVRRKKRSRATTRVLEPEVPTSALEPEIPTTTTMTTGVVWCSKCRLTGHVSCDCTSTGAGDHQHCSDGGDSGDQNFDLFS